MSETYYCQCAGHEGDRAFEAAPASWFLKRQMPLPRNCPTCKKWMDGQEDEAVRCSSCGENIRISARYKISFHKREGPYKSPSECAQCELDEPPPRLVRDKVPPVSREATTRTEFQRLELLRPANEYDVDIEPGAYEHSVRRDKQSRESRREHLEKHTVWSPHSTVGRDSHTTATALASHDPTFEGLLRSVSVVTHSTNNDRVREYVDARHGRVVRVTLTDSGQIEVTFIESTPGTNDHAGHEIVTTYSSSFERVWPRIGRDWL